MRRASSKFYTEYNKAPEVTRQRLYLETMQQVYANTSKVMIDAKGQGNLLYLPLDKLMAARRGATAATSAFRQSQRTAQSSAAGRPPQRRTADSRGTLARQRCIA